MVDIDTFWAVIDRARARASDMAGSHDACAARADSGGLVASLVVVLGELSRDEIACWQQVFELYMDLSDKPKLWAAAVLINDGCDDHAFNYFQAWLITQGRDVFFATMADPDSLADVVERGISCEDDLPIVAGMALGHDEWPDPKPLPDTLITQLTAQIRYADDIDSAGGDDLVDLLPRLSAVVSGTRSV